MDTDHDHPSTNTGMLQPAEVPSNVIDESCFGDPCCLNAMQQAEEQNLRKEMPRDRHDNSHGTSSYDSIRSGREDSNAKKRRLWKLLAISSYFALIIVEAIFGYLSGSVACVTATVHMLSDYLGEHSSGRHRSNASRRAECIIILLCVAVLLVANSAFMVAAVGRLYAKNYTIDETYMLVAAVITLTANCVMLAVHFSRILRPRRFLPLSGFIAVRSRQIAHAVGNHGSSLVLFAAAILLYFEREWIIVDSIATFVLALAILSNAAAVTTEYCSELKRIRARRDTYEVL
ncbi:Zinc transporter 8 [Toxocara canis]|uniref:Zinc transporter 8 n=1 Tax=Toxocara canis TaxID=6265 RepID=A0A0B2V6P8_TOXCA|nr:Zinc transporter 8 [Toxocara canis]